MREAIINSLCHRQWERYNLLNSIAIYDDRVEIGNPGIFPSQITPENIKEPHDSYPYNVKMAEVLYRSMGWRTGAAASAASSKPAKSKALRNPHGVGTADSSMSHSNVRLTTDQPLINGQHQSSPKSIQEQGRSIQESIRENASSHKSIQDSIQEIKNNRDKVLFILSKNPNITLEEVAKIIGLSRIGVQKFAGNLKEVGILSRDGSTKAGKWVVNRKS